jgi:hypothetical protein
MQQPTQPTQTRPNFQPTAQGYNGGTGQPPENIYNPQWEQPQGIPVAGGQGPIPAPQQPQQPQVEIRPPESQSFSFVPDAKTKELVERVYPELTNAFINLAIKKFSESSDYADYFVREEFKQVAQEEVKEKKQEESAPAPEAAAGFSSW